MKFSQCMIVKNEEKNIEKALSWGKGVVDEQIVVDTGSTDKTVEIAEKMGATVYHFEWIKDFSAAKNFALEKCTGDWIAFLDADEYFEEDVAKRLRGMLESLNKRYNVVVTSLANLDADGRILEVVQQSRLFRNVPYLRFKGAIHENITSANDKAPVEIYVANQNFTIFHTGYAFKDRNDEMSIRKAKRNKEIILKKIEENPDDAMNYYYLYDVCSLEEDYEKAVEYAKKGIETNQRVPQKLFLERECYDKVLKGLHQIIVNKKKKEKIDEFKEYYNKAIKLYPDYPDYYLWYGDLLSDIEEYEESVKIFELLLNKLILNNEFEGVVLGQLDIIYYKLVYAYNKLGNVQNVVKYAVQYIQINKYGKEIILTSLISAFLQNNTTEQQVFEFLSKIYDMKSAKDFIFVLRCAKGAVPDSFADYLIKNMPDNLKKLIDEEQ
ncbi:MAG: glycosyltransferase [Clostridiales bacterium]|nr:glycosyltransferase [Clostridiales bacterium]